MEKNLCAVGVYNDADYDHVREEFPVTGYYTGDYKLSLNMYTFNSNIISALNGKYSPPPISTLDTIKWAADNGFDGVDVTLYYIPGYSASDVSDLPDSDIINFVRQVWETAKMSGIEISGTGIKNDFADPDPARREMDIKRIKYWLKPAEEMGAPVMRVFSGLVPEDIGTYGWEYIAKNRIAPPLREVADYAAKNHPGVLIAIQNHGDMLCSANQTIQLIKWIGRKNVGVVNDTGSFMDFMSTDSSKYKWYDDIALVNPYSFNFQLKTKPAGAGTKEDIDLIRFFTDLRKSPYRGYVPIELLWTKAETENLNITNKLPFEQTKEFLETVRRAMTETKTEKEQSSFAAFVFHCKV